MVRPARLRIRQPDGTELYWLAARARGEAIFGALSFYFGRTDPASIDRRLGRAHVVDGRLQANGLARSILGGGRPSDATLRTIAVFAPELDLTGVRDLALWRLLDPDKLDIDEVAAILQNAPQDVRDRLWGRSANRICLGFEGDYPDLSALSPLPATLEHLVMLIALARYGGEFGMMCVIDAAASCANAAAVRLVATLPMFQRRHRAFFEATSQAVWSLTTGPSAAQFDAEVEKAKATHSA